MDDLILNRFILIVYKIPLFALILSGILIIWAIWVVLKDNNKFHRPFINAINMRLDGLKEISPTNEIDANREYFRLNYSQINSLMSSEDGSVNHEFAHAWREFRETIIDESAEVISTTNRPGEYFLHLGEDAKGLLFWANIFVATGLVLTFLGIVAALTQTVDTLSASNGGSNMTEAVVGLLKLTAVKFWTSIAGVGVSIRLRFIDRKWKAEHRRGLEKLCMALELGTEYTSIQAIVANQLKEQKEQTGAIKILANQLIEGFSNAFNQQMSPMLSSLNGISGHIEEFKSGSFGQIGKELGDALSKNAGAEMQELAIAIQGMSESMAQIHIKLNESGERANSQIAEAINRMNSSAEAMNERYEQMNLRLEEMTSKLTSQTEEAAASNAKLLGDAAIAISNAAARASGSINSTIDDVLNAATENSAKAMETAFSGFGEKFGDVSGRFINSIEGASSKFELAAGSIDRSTQSSSQHADKMAEVNLQTIQIAKTLEDASKSFDAATLPIKSSSDAISEAVSSLKIAALNAQKNIETQKEAIAEISRSLTEANSAASSSWKNYIERFEDVDKALSQVVSQIVNVTREHGNELNRQTAEIDTQLARGLDGLAVTVSALKEYGGNIDDLLNELKRKA